MATINPGFATELKKYGALDFNKCYNCGNCTAVCSLSTGDNSFPREMIRFSVLGLEREIQKSTTPWLCYYCGECSATCPQQTDPGELMMSLRRYLTSKYDWTGLGAKLYTSKLWEFGTIAFLALVVLFLFVFFHGPMTNELTADGGVMLNTFAPWQQIEIGDLLMGGFLAFFLMSNIFNMYLKIIGSQKDLKIPFKLYFSEFWKLIVHFGTQREFSKCDTKLEQKKPALNTYWVVHWFLMSSYVIMFVMIVAFLGWFQTDNIYAWFHPQRILGYYATVGLTIGIVYFFVQRIKKSAQKSKHSHVTDWTFLVLLFLTTISGILVHVFRLNGMPQPTYYMYVFHLMALVPMLMIEVPFSKWSHLAYRPFAIYFNKIIVAAKKSK
ncbi:MAG: 4Fe-4S dicluster domain-containing protein [Bacteroidetes bacterium]|nr:4Fe-4S dicluster domain-containing protein [Bacteroidota bacterium]MBU1720302.1 4Fe-4S dicluster domain-containing protein [Bacteroidota bacterium]